VIEVAFQNGTIQHVMPVVSGYKSNSDNWLGELGS
jgi:hypothetical protein